MRHGCHSEVVTRGHMIPQAPIAKGMSWNELVSALNAFLTARDHAGWHTVIEAHPELFARDVGETLASVPCPAADPEERAEQEQFARLSLARLKIVYAGSLLKQIRHKNDDSHLELLVSACEDALAVMRNSGGGATEVASVSTTLGGAYLRRRQGDAIENQNCAISLWQGAIPLLTKKQDNVAFALQTAIADTSVALSEDVGDDALVSAIEVYQKAARLARRLGNRERWADTLQKLGHALAKKKNAGNEDLKLGIKAYDDALTVFTRKKDPNKWAHLQLSLADVYQKLRSDNPSGNLKQAIVAYENALAVLTRKDHPDDWARATVNLAAAYGNDLSGNVAQRRRAALDLVQSALEIISEQHDAETWATAQDTRGILYLDLNEGHPAENVECAIAAFKSAQQIFARGKNKHSWAGLMMNLAIAYARRIKGDPAENNELAIEAINCSLSIFTRQYSPELWCRAQSILGEVYVNRLRGSVEENLEAAIAALSNALAMPLAHREGYVHAHLGIAQLRHATEAASANRGADLEAGIASLKRALTKIDRERDPFAWAGIQHTLGIGYKDKGRCPEAIDAYASALTVFRAEKYPRQRADVLANLANLMGECVHESREGNVAWVSKAVSTLMYRLAIIGDAEFSTLLGVLSEVSIIAPAVVARVGKDKARQAQLFTLTTELLIALWNQAIQSLPPGVDDRRRSDFMCRLAEWQMSLGQFDDAAHLLERALELRDGLVARTVTRENVFDAVSRTSGLGETLAYCRIRLGQPQLGLEEFERAQAAELRRMLASEAPLLAELDEERRETFVAARAKLRQLQYEFSRDATSPGLQRSGADVAAEIRTTQTALMNALGEAQSCEDVDPPLSASDILALTPGRGAVIVPLVTFQGGAAYVIASGTSGLTKDNVIELPKLTRRAVEDRLRSWRAGYETLQKRADQGDPEAWRSFEPIIEDVLSWLWEELMGPALGAAQNAGVLSGQQSEIIVLASGGLSYLPLHAAWSKATNKHVLDDFATAVVPSFYALKASYRRASESNRGCGGLVGVFDPQQDDPDFSLELSETFEWPQLRNSFQRHGEGAKALIGKAATSANVRSESRGAGYLHFSCHNEFDWSRPDRSGIVLASGEVMDLRQIAGELQLPHCRLVSIAACETAITAAGKLASEQVGLPAAFIQAGAPAVVATLWPVMDWSTSVVMARMYDLLLDHDLRPAHALRQAVLEFRDGQLPASVLADTADIDPDLHHRLAFFWAPFVAIGH
jgi:tetratricopeptide (TPR) repeat protein